MEDLDRDPLIHNLLGESPLRGSLLRGAIEKMLSPYVGRHMTENLRLEIENELKKFFPEGQLVLEFENGVAKVRVPDAGEIREIVEPLSHYRDVILSYKESVVGLPADAVYLKLLEMHFRDCDIEIHIEQNFKGHPYWAFRTNGMDVMNPEVDPQLWR